MIDLIVSENPDAVEMRKKCIFYIVPFINPDGVTGGYSRSTSTGVNIEVNWDRPDSLTMPEVKALKAKMKHQIHSLVNGNLKRKAIYLPQPVTLNFKKIKF
jgi:murein tripeptide amidase MpaA